MTDINFRRKHIGGSDIPKILGLTPPSWGDIIDLAGFHWGHNDGPEPNAYMKRGTALEPEAREAYMQFTGNLVSPVEDMESKTHSYCSASLDGWTPSADLVVEIKCPYSSKTLVLAKEGKMQANYYAQVQWQLFVTGIKLAHFWVWHPENGHALIEVPENKEFQEIEFKAAEAYWKAIQAGHTPDPNFMVAEAKEALETVSIVDQGRYNEIKDPEKPLKQRKEKWKELKLVIDKQKEETKFLELEIKNLETEILEFTDGEDTIVEDMKICHVKPRVLVDWKKVQAGLEITDEQLKPYKKETRGYYKFSLIEKTP